MNTVLNIGSLNIDLVYQVPHIVQPGETLSCTLSSESAGGKGANQSVALSLAGLRVYHAGKVGQDGLWLCQILEEKGVDISLISVDAKEKTGHAVIQVSEAGENSIVLLGGANQKISRSYIDSALKKKPWDMLVLQNEINELPYILEKAHEEKIPVIFNAAPYSPSLTSLHNSLAQLHTLVVNETEAMQLTETDHLETAFEKLLQYYPKVRIVMTMGEVGVKAAHMNKIYFIPAQKVGVVDSTAAGDTFLGYYTQSILSTDHLSQALELATKASAITVGRAGAMTSIPHRSEI